MLWSAELVPFGEETALVFPDDLLETMGWSDGDEFNWKVEKGKLTLTRCPPKSAEEESAAS